MDRYCEKCGEPWDVLGIIDEDLENEVPELDIDNECTVGNFRLSFYLGREEIEHFIILECEACKRRCIYCKERFYRNEIEYIEDAPHCKECAKIVLQDMED